MALRFDARPAWGSMNERMKQAARATCLEMAEAGAAHIKEHMREEGKTDTDLTAQSVKAGPVEEVSPGLFRCIVATAPQQMTSAVVLEDGRKPGKGVSRLGRTKLATWARRKAPEFVARLLAERDAAAKAAGGRPKGIKADREKAAADEAAFLIARAIRRRGLPPFAFFKRAGDHVRGKMREIQQRVLARFGQGGGR